MAVRGKHNVKEAFMRAAVRRSGAFASRILRPDGLDGLDTRSNREGVTLKDDSLSTIKAAAV